MALPKFYPDGTIENRLQEKVAGAGHQLGDVATVEIKDLRTVAMKIINISKVASMGLVTYLLCGVREMVLGFWLG